MVGRGNSDYIPLPIQSSYKHTTHFQCVGELSLNRQSESSYVKKFRSFMFFDSSACFARQLHGLSESRAKQRSQENPNEILHKLREGDISKKILKFLCIRPLDFLLNGLKIKVKFSKTVIVLVICSFQNNGNIILLLGPLQYIVNVECLIIQLNHYSGRILGFFEKLCRRP